MGHLDNYIMQRLSQSSIISCSTSWQDKVTIERNSQVGIYVGWHIQSLEAILPALHLGRFSKFRCCTLAGFWCIIYVPWGAGFKSRETLISKMSGCFVTRPFDELYALLFSCSASHCDGIEVCNKLPKHDKKNNIEKNPMKCLCLVLWNAIPPFSLNFCIPAGNLLFHYYFFFKERLRNGQSAHRWK